jgi:hypothetical protein
MLKTLNLHVIYEFLKLQYTQCFVPSNVLVHYQMYGELKSCAGLTF